jgi:hypothetical protein
MARFKGCFIHGIKRVRPGRRWEAVQGRRRWHSPALVLKEEEEAGWAEWAIRPNRLMGWLGRVGLVRPARLKGRWGCWADWAEI